MDLNKKKKRRETMYYVICAMIAWAACKLLGVYE